MKSPGLLVWGACVALVGPAWSSEFRDTKYGFVLSPPEFANPASGTSTIRLAVNAPPEAGFASNMNVMIQQMQTTQDQYIALSEKQFAAAGMTVRSLSKCSVSGQPGVLFEYEGQMAGRGLRFLSLAVVLPERVLLITYTATASSFGKLEKEFRRSLESFKLAGK